MKITVKWLEEKNACSDGKEWFKGQTETDAVLVIEKLITEEKLDWANWTLCRLLTRKDKIRYAIFAAQQTIENFEKFFPDDKRPRQAIEAALTYLNKPTKANQSAAESARSAAESAAWSAWSAAWSAWSAAWSAESAARSAAESARSAWSAAWSAESAARSAAESARRAAESARSAALKKILRNGLDLLQKKAGE